MKLVFSYKKKKIFTLGLIEFARNISRCEGLFANLLFDPEAPSQATKNPEHGHNRNLANYTRKFCMSDKATA
jgi:hypothetical protein